MSKLRKWVAVLGMVATLNTAVGTLHAGFCRESGSGYAYDDCRRAPCISPSVAVGTVAIVAAIAVIIHNKGQHSHHHSTHSGHS